MSIVLVLAATLRPAAPDPDLPGVLCWQCGERGLADALVNIVLFVPIGLAIGARGGRPGRAALLGLLLAAGIEVAQALLPGRAPTVRDAVTNAVGAGLGGWLWTGIPLALATADRARRAAFLAAGLAVALAAAGSWLLVADPAADAYFAQVVPRLAHLEPWTGRLDSVRLGALPLTHGRVREQRALAQALAERAPLRLSGRHGTPTTRLGAMLAVTDADRNEILLVGPEGEDLVVRWQRRAHRLALDAPTERFPGALAHAVAGAPFTMEVTGLPGTPCIALDGGVPRCGRAAPAGRGWALLYWRPRWATGFQRALDALTLLVLLAPVSLFARAAGGRWGAALPAVTAAALVTVLRVGGQAWPVPAEWGAIAGALLWARLPRAAASPRKASRA